MMVVVMVARRRWSPPFRVRGAMKGGVGAGAKGACLVPLASGVCCVVMVVVGGWWWWMVDGDEELEVFWGSSTTSCKWCGYFLGLLPVSKLCVRMCVCRVGGSERENVLCMVIMANRGERKSNRRGRAHDSDWMERDEVIHHHQHGP